MQTQTPQPSRILRRESVQDRTGKSKSTIYREIKLGTFPKPLRLGANSVGWLETDIESYIQKLAKGGAQ